jgi:hypothetical protein
MKNSRQKEWADFCYQKTWLEKLNKCHSDQEKEKLSGINLETKAGNFRAL